jgi:acyl-coenzyme A synthetase/AMP-(fatty) acid ligase/acyl carrier protein
VLHLTPALSQMITTGGGNSNLSSLRYAFFAADLLTRHDVARLTAIAPEATCVNFYGATETPQAMGFYVVPREDTREGFNNAKPIGIPLGKGIEGVQLLVLNAEGQLCGIGELGEIYIRTPYLAQGYVGNEALTAQRFLINPFNGDSGDRIYRTGDLGRYDSVGDVLFAGRADDQIKIRGFRVEPGAIQAAIRQYPGADSAAVVARSRQDGERILAAYVVPRSGVELNIRELLSFLHGQLPDYMVPTAFEIVQSLPFNANGKLDRRALLDLNSSGISLHVNYVKPGSPMEQRLADIWSALLGITRIGAKDNFFDLGGHSLLAMQLLSRISHACGRDIPLKSLFDNPTLAGLAAAIDESPNGSDSPVPEIRRIARKRHPSLQPADFRKEET